MKFIFAPINWNQNVIMSPFDNWHEAESISEEWCVGRQAGVMENPTSAFWNSSATGNYMQFAMKIGSPHQNRIFQSIIQGNLYFIATRVSRNSIPL